MIGDRSQRPTAEFRRNPLASQEPPPPHVLFENVRVWDGTAESLTGPTRVLVESNLIKAIGSSVAAGPQATRIDGGGRTLMPGLIPSHVHLNLQHMLGGYETMEDRDWQEIGAMAGFAAYSLLVDGFTTVRDPGTLQSGMRRAIDAGHAIGPRIYNSGAVISQTSGHGDWRKVGFRTRDSRTTFKAGQLGMTFIVDGYDEVLGWTAIPWKTSPSSVAARSCSKRRRERPVRSRPCA